MSWHSEPCNGFRLGYPSCALYPFTLDGNPQRNTQKYKNKMSLIRTQKQNNDTIETLKRHIKRLEDMNWNLKQEIKKYEKQK